jgi:hypothetical protein
MDPLLVFGRFFRNCEYPRTRKIPPALFYLKEDGEIFYINSGYYKM